MTKISLKVVKIGVAVAAAVVLFFSYIVLRFQPEPQIFSWPDEMATAVFAQQFAKTESLRISQPLNEIFFDLVHPRSTNIFEHQIVPTGFIGMPLMWGGVSRLVGFSGALYASALLAVIAAFCLYRIVAYFFDEKVGIISAFVFALQPAWWYYANFSLLPNVPFVALLIIGAYFLLPWMRSKCAESSLAFGSIFISLALMIRPNEVWWVIALLVAWFMPARKNISLRQGVILWAPAMVLAVAYLNINYATYGGFFSAGYMPLNGEGAQVLFIEKIVRLFFPFGINPVLIAKTLIRDLAFIHLPFIGLALYGIYLMIRSMNMKAYAILSALVSVYLAAYYLSMPINDEFSYIVSNLGRSSHRYLLPAIALMAPVVAVAVNALTSQAKSWKNYLTAGILFALSCLSAYHVFFGKNDNIRLIRSSIAQYHELRRDVLSKTPGNAVIITERADKWLYPERDVIRTANLLAAPSSALQGLRDLRPLFILTHESEGGVDALKPYLGTGKLSRPVVLEGGYALYEIQ